MGPAEYIRRMEMSMIIRDFDLPKAGEVLILKIYPDRGVVVCPGTECEAIDNIVVPIPKRHGRLIDGDALYKFFEDALNKNPLDDWWEAGAVLDNIELAPTILEAEDLL